MSLKVYRAYKLRDPRQFWETVRYIQKRGKESVQARLLELYYAWIPTVDPKKEEFKKALAVYSAIFNLKGNAAAVDFYARLEVVGSTFREGYRAAAAGTQKDLFDFDVSLTFRELNGQIYLIPYCSGLLAEVLDFLDKDRKRFKEYHFQNQSDPPPVTEVSRREWKERGKVWQALTEPGEWENYLCLEICSWRSWWQIDPRLRVKYVAG